jgi:trehalose 6-phosphate phosphatase
LKPILRPRHRGALEAFAGSDVLVAFDFDGTLAPLVADPATAAMRAETARRLRQVAGSRPCVVISGRARADVRRRLGGAPVRGVIGNHGAEPWRGAERLARRIEQWKARLERDLAAEAGVWIEDKTYSLAVHYRGARKRAGARGRILAAAGRLAGARLVPGTWTVNVLGRDAPHKGAALETERRRLGCRLAIYVGDDETDEDVFAAGSNGRLLGIRVGASRRSRASYFVPSQRDIDRLLRLLADAGKGPSRPGAGRRGRKP